MARKRQKQHNICTRYEPAVYGQGGVLKMDEVGQEGGPKSQSFGRTS